MLFFFLSFPFLSYMDQKQVLEFLSPKIFLKMPISLLLCNYPWSHSILFCALDFCGGLLPGLAAEGPFSTGKLELL